MMGVSMLPDSVFIQICEDESLARQAALWPRVLREPIKRSGHVVLDL